MYKVLRSYSRKSEKKHDQTGGQVGGGPPGNGEYAAHHQQQQQQQQNYQPQSRSAPYATSTPSSVRNGHSGGSSHQQQHHNEFYQQHGTNHQSDSHYKNGHLIPAGEHRHYDTSWTHEGGGLPRQGFSESSSYEAREHYERKVQKSKKTRGERERRRVANGTGVNGGTHEIKRISESAYQASDGISARDALLQWAKRVTSGYSGVSVNNFTNSWKDGRAFNAILHFYKPTAVNWEKISDKSVSNHERLRHAFDAFEKEFGISKLLDPEDVDVDNPDEKSIITYVSSLYNTLCHDEASQGNFGDLTSRLTRGIGITNEKLDHLLARTEETDMTRTTDVERQLHDIADELVALETPIAEFFEDVEVLKQHRHHDAVDFHRQVLGLHQRRAAYFDRVNSRLGISSNSGGMTNSMRTRETIERYESTRTNAFARVEESVKWVRERLDRLNNMQFSETLETLEEVFERHKIDNHEIQDYRQKVDECIARQAEVSAEDSYDYCELLQTLESEYQQLRDLSAGRMIDLDSLIAFIRAAQQELVWIHDREIIEVARNWSDINQLDLPMLQNYYRQLLHEIEIREKQFNDVHNQGAALINQRHPASDVIEVYLRTMQNQWDWLLNLSKCLESHLRDALNLKSFLEESEQVEQWMQRQIEHLEQSYNRTEFSLEEGERYLRELDEIREVVQRYHGQLMQLTERCNQISPLWQRGERIAKPIVITALCDYKSKEITIRQGDDCTLLNNSDLVQWRVRGADGYDADVPSVVFRVPPPDPRLATYLSRLATQFEKLRKLWDKKHRQVRYNMVLNTMKTVRDWDLNTFMAIPPEQRDEIIKALNDDAAKLLSELDPNDPLALRLREELALTNEHFYNLLNSAQKGPESEYSNKYDEKMAELLKKLDDAWKRLNGRVGENISTTINELEHHIHEHKNFEDALQALDVDVSNVKELFRQLPDPTPSQRANYELLSGRWEDLWDLSRMYVERLKALESVLQGLDEVTDIVRRHEITLSSFDDLPSALDKLRGVHSQLIELNMVLQQQQEYVQTLNKNVALLRQHVSRTRFNASSHPDVDRLEDEVQKITVRWDNVCSQVSERLRIAEEAQQSQMIYRSQYDEEILWLDRVEETINSLRRPENLRPEELQAQLDQLVAEYAQLQEHTATIENINKEGGKFICEAKGYDMRLNQYHDTVVSTHGVQVKSEVRRSVPQPKNGAQIVTEELEALNRRFAQLSSVILERKNIVNVLIQNWKRKQQDAFYSDCVRRTTEISTLLNELRGVQRVQEEYQFDFGSVDATTNARSQFSLIRKNLMSYASRIEESVNDTERLCKEGVETLSPEQFHSLRENQTKLRATYESILSQTDAVLDRLDLATALLIEFSTKSSQLQSWIFEKSSEIGTLRRSVGDTTRLAESRRALKSLDEEIAQKVGDELKRLTQLASRINVEICNYIDELRRKEMAAAHLFPQLHHQQINETVERVQEDYAALIRAKNELSQFLNRLKTLTVQHEKRLSAVTGWLSDLEESLANPAMDSLVTEKRLSKLLEVQRSLLENRSRIDEFNSAARLLVDATVGTNAHETVEHENNRAIDTTETRYSRLNQLVSDKVNKARAEKTQHEGLQRGVAEMASWLDDAEPKMLKTRSLPLDLLKLNDFKYEHQAKYGELNGKSATLDHLTQLLAQMRDSAPEIVEAEQLDKRLDQSRKRLRRLHSGVDALNQNLADLMDALTQLHAKNSTMANEQVSLANKIVALDPTDVEVVTAVEARLTKLVGDSWNELEALARRVISIPDIESTKTIDILMQNSEAGLSRLQRALETKLSTGEKLRQERVNFCQNFDDVNAVLQDAESRIRALAQLDALDVIALDALKTECDALKQMLSGTRIRVDQAEVLGAAYIEASGGKRHSLNLDSITSSGTDTLGQVARGLFDLRRRQEEAERALTDIARHASDAGALLDMWTTQHEALKRWLASNITQLAALSEGGLLPEIDRLTTTRNKLAELDVSRVQKQAELNAFNLKTQQILSFPDANSQERVTQLRFVAARDEINAEWTQLETSVTALVKCVELIVQVVSADVAIAKWLASKRKMFIKLCGALTDVKQLDNQLIVVQMLDSDMHEEEMKLQEMKVLASKALIALGDNAHAETSRALREFVENINGQWLEFGAEIRGRNETLTRLQALNNEFDALSDAIKHELMDADELVNGATISSGADEARALKLERIDSAERAVRVIVDRTKALDELCVRVRDAAPAETSVNAQLEQRTADAKYSMDALLRKIAALRDAAMSESIARNELLSGLDELIARAKSLAPQVEVDTPLSADSAKLADFVVRFTKLAADIDATHDGEVTFISRKAAELLGTAPDPELTRKSRTLTEEWRALQNNAKTRGQNIEKARKLVEEFDSLEYDAENALADATRQFVHLKKNDALNHAPLNAVLDVIEQKIERAYALLDQLNELCVASDLKRHRLRIDELRRQHAHIADDCQTHIETAREKNDLLHKFDVEVKALRSYFDVTRLEYKLGADFTDNQRLALGKESLNEGAARFDAKCTSKLGELHRGVVRDLRKLIDTNEQAEIRRALDELDAGHNELREAFRRVATALEHDQNTFEEIEARTERFVAAVDALITKASESAGIARELEALQAQERDADALLADMNATAGALNQLADDCRAHFVEKKGAAQQNASIIFQRVQELTHKVERTRAEVLQRKRAISSTRERIMQVKREANTVLNEMEKTRGSDLLAMPPTADIGELRDRQSAVLRLKGAELRLLDEKVDEVSSMCKELIRSASNNVSTFELEDTLSQVSSKWQELSALVENQERHIDATLQGVGNYNDAHAALLDWLEQTEELFAAQKPPSADYKVVRAQLQSHEFQTRLINDKKPSVAGFVTMIDKLKPLAHSEAQKAQLQPKVDDVVLRYEELQNAAEHRRQLLQDAHDLTFDFSQEAQEFGKFLDDANKTLVMFGKIPTDAEKLEQQINLQRELQEQVDGRRDAFNRLMELYATIVKFVDVEDANELEASVRSICFRYEEVKIRCSSCGQLLAALAEDISSFIHNTNQLAEWLDVAENEIQKFGELSTFPDELVLQSEELTKLAIAVAEQGALVSQVVEESRELCTHASGGEAIALQYRIDCLRQRYSQLAVDAEAKIAALSKAIPLSEELRDGYQEVTDFLDGVDEDLENLEQVSWSEQTQIIETIEAEMTQFRSHIDELQTMCVDLQRLSCEAKANELAKRSQEISLRFNTTADLVSRKADQLKNVERQSRHTFDILDFWIDWFNETRDSIRNAEPPSVDMSFLRAQLKQQRALNEEIANERVGLRNIIVDASRIVRELSASFTNQESDLIAKVEKTKKLAEDTTEVGLERTAALEQALVLCQELDESYTELSDWMEETEEVLNNCDAITTGMSAKALLQQQLHNNNMLQAIQSQRPIISKFERNIAALSELCSEIDAANLRQITDQVLERFSNLADAFRERGDALASTIEQSSEFSDRLNIFLANLQGALNQIRHSDAASARIPILRQQIADNAEIIELMKQKEEAFRTMKSNAQEVLMQAREDSPAVRDIAQNIETLDDLWLELQSGATARHNILTECLQCAEEFWQEYEQCQSATIALSRDVEAVHIDDSNADPAEMDAWRRDRLSEVESNLRGPATAQVEKMRTSGAKFCEKLNDADERTYVQQHLTLFDANWNAFTQMFAQLRMQLTSNIDLTARFHELYAALERWLRDIEQRVSALSTAPATDEVIRDVMARVDEMRREIDEKTLQREQLSTLGAEVCVGVPPAQAAVVRNSLSELNQRWNRLVGQLAKHLQQLERSLLEMGQFLQAHDQFSAWMSRASGTLEEMKNTRPVSLKHVEIELCKFRVLHNDIYAHQPSYEAILRAGTAFLRNKNDESERAESSSAFTQSTLDSLAERWQLLNRNAEQLCATLEAAQHAVGERSAQLDNWALWLIDVLGELKTTRPIGGLPETAVAQLDEFRILAADIEQRREKFVDELDRLAEQLASTSDGASDASSPLPEEDNGKLERKKRRTRQKVGDDMLLEKQYTQLKRDWETVQMKLVEREAKLTDALQNAIELQDGMNDISDWLAEAANALSLAPIISRLPDTLKKQLAEHAAFNEDVHAQKDRLKELYNKSVRIQLACEKKDAIPMKNKLVSLKHAMDKIVQRTVERSRLLDNASADTSAFFEAHSELLKWVEASIVQLNEANDIPTTSNVGGRIRELLDTHKAFQEQIKMRKPTYETIQQRGRALEEHAPPMEKTAVASASDTLREKWEVLTTQTLKRRQSLDEALTQSGKFEEVMADMLIWLDATLSIIDSDEDGCSGDVDTVHALLKEHYTNVAEPLKARRPNLETLHQRASQIFADKRDDDDAEVRAIREQMNDVDTKWKRLIGQAAEREGNLTVALEKAVDLSELLHDFQDFVADMESKIRRITVPTEEMPTLEELKRVEELRTIIVHKSADVERIMELARRIHAQCNKRAELTMRELIRSVTGRWELLNNLLIEKTDKLNARVDTIREHEKQLKSLMEFIEEKRAELAILSNSDDQGHLDRLGILVDELEMFKATLRERQTDVDEARRIMKRTSATSVQIQTPGASADTLPTKQPQKKSSAVPSSAIALANASSKTAKKSEKKSTASARQQFTDKMSEEWTTLWTETSAYEARLVARRADLEELKRLESFTFDEWRERYLAWNDHGKARISDLFRRIDKSGTGVVPRKLFIDGILVSKFPTTILEMNKVADEFDKGDGHISAKEFMNALRYDPKKRSYKPKTESERIHEEIARETTRCTCAHRFPIQHISSDDNDSRVQYGFGFGNTMKRMVRILRSTVMVRVGGGWEALDEFLLKHDPCRAKGRINVEMLHGHEYRIPFGSTDHMAAFTSRKNITPSSSSSLASTTAAPGHRLGPIMKIREKTERSVPMFKKPTTPKSPSSSIFSTPFQQPRRRGSDDLILNETTRIPRPTTLTAASSRSSSRQNLANLLEGLSSSRSASRCSSLAGGSDISTLSRIHSPRDSKTGTSKDFS